MFFSVFPLFPTFSSRPSPFWLAPAWRGDPFSPIFPFFRSPVHYFSLSLPFAFLWGALVVFFGGFGGIFWVTSLLLLFRFVTMFSAPFSCACTLSLAVLPPVFLLLAFGRILGEGLITFVHYYPKFYFIGNMSFVCLSMFFPLFTVYFSVGVNNYFWYLYCVIYLQLILFW